MATVSANGLTLTYESTGDDSAPPVMLIMGLGGQLTHWPDEFCERIAAAGFRVIRFDNRDIGLSSRIPVKPPNLIWQSIRMLFKRPVRAPYTLHDMALDAVGLLDALGIDSAHCVGVSMGGMIGQLLAAKHRERLRSLISIMSTTADPKLPQASRQVRSRMFFGRPKSNRIEDIVENSMGVWRLIGSPGYPRDEAELRASVRRNVERSYDPQGFLRQTLAVMATGSLVELDRTITLPTLVIHGTDDPLVPVEGGKHTAAQIPGARLELIEGMGHDLPPALIPRLTDLIIEHLRAIEAGAADEASITEAR